MNNERLMSFLGAHMVASKAIDKYKLGIDEGNDNVFVAMVVALDESVKLVHELMYNENDLKGSKKVSFEELMADLKKEEP